MVTSSCEDIKKCSPHANTVGLVRRRIKLTLGNAALNSVRKNLRTKRTGLDQTNVQGGDKTAYIAFSFFVQQAQTPFLPKV